MIQVRPSNERGKMNIGWLDTNYTFSFARYYDPKHMGFRSLRVINQDKVKPGTGFNTHPHNDMEIITYIIDGELEHRDNLGSRSVIRRGDIQRISAGTGVTHSETNPSSHEAVHLLQIWIQPDREGHTPSYDERSLSDAERTGKLLLIASNKGRDGSMTINQDADVYNARLPAGETVTHSLGEGRGAWIQIVSGNVALNGVALGPGDGASVEDVAELAMHAENDAELLLFDLA